MCTNSLYCHFSRPEQRETEMRSCWAEDGVVIVWKWGNWVTEQIQMTPPPTTTTSFTQRKWKIWKCLCKVLLLGEPGHPTMTAAPRRRESSAVIGADLICWPQRWLSLMTMFSPSARRKLMKKLKGFQTQALLRVKCIICSHLFGLFVNGGGYLWVRTGFNYSTDQVTSRKLWEKKILTISK